MDDNLELKKDFLGFFEVENIKNVTLVNAIKDIVLRFNFGLQHYVGKT